MWVDMMVLVIVMVHHGDTLYHDQADTAPLLGTYIIYLVWMLEVKIKMDGS